MAVDPQIVAAEQKYRTALLGGNPEAKRALVKAYTGTFRAVTEDLNKITAQIDAARKAGDVISASWLMNQQRYRDLQVQTGRMIDVMATSLGQAIPQDQKMASLLAESLVGQASGPIFNKLPAAAVEGVIGTTAKGSPLRTLLDTFNVGAKDDASRFIRSRLIAGIALGRPSKRIAQEITRGVENLTLSRAMTISRTETQRALRRATAMSIEANKDLVAGWVWRSAADEGTCAACFSLHGTFFPGSTPMRAHPNCRCVMIPKRKVKDDPMGFGTGVKVGNGKELFDALPEAAQRRILGPGRLALYKEGKVPFSGMRVLKENPIWGASYQVKSLQAIKADLDKPPPVPKPKVLKPTPVAPPALDAALDPVDAAIALAKAKMAPKPVPVAPGTRRIQQAEAKVAAQEARLLEIAQAERRFDAEIPVMSGDEGYRWKFAQSTVPDPPGPPHIIRVMEEVSDDSIYLLSQNTRTLLNQSWSADAHGHFYNPMINKVFLPDGRVRFEITVARTTRKVSSPNGSYSSMLDPNYRASLLRALPSRTEAQALILRKAAVEKALTDAKIALERLRNPDLSPRRTAQARPAPREITQDEFVARQADVVAAQDEFNTATQRYASARDMDLRDGAASGRLSRQLVSDLDPVKQLPPYGDSWITSRHTGHTYYVKKVYSGGDDVILVRVKAEMVEEVKQRMASGGLSYEGFLAKYADIDSALARRMDATALHREYSAWHEYQLLSKISKKPITDVPVALSGASAPIPVTSSFAGKPRKWTQRDDFNNAGRAKDQVSYEIAERLSKDDAFIQSMARNDALGDWITGAGRGARPAVKDAADKWRGWTVQEREAFLRSGTIDSGYYTWQANVYRTIGPNGPVSSIDIRRGAWNNAMHTDGKAFIYDYTSQMVQQWAVSSGDSHILSVAMQRAAMQEFSLQATTTLEHFAGRRHVGGYGVDPGDLLQQSEVFYQTNGESIQRFLRHMYDQTQEELALAGIDTVRVVRGVGSLPRAAQRELGISSLNRGQVVEAAVDLQPMSSFAVDTKTAKGFGGNLIYVDVPASWVVGTARTGFGCLNEFEWVLLGGPMRATITFAPRY